MAAASPAFRSAGYDGELFEVGAQGCASHHTSTLSEVLPHPTG